MYLTTGSYNKGLWLTRHHFFSLLSTIFLLAVLSGQANAFQSLTDVQKLVYDTSHLQNTRTNDVIEYHYQAKLLDGEQLDDNIVLTVTAETDEQRRDVSINFLSGEQKLNLPDFPGYRGNPVIIAMLEHLAQKLGQETGGGVLYFRNRIRDALSDKSVEVELAAAEYESKTIDSQMIRLKPFVNDPYLGAHPQYLSTEIKLVLSDMVPGGVLTIRMQGGLEKSDEFTRELKLRKAPHEW